MDHLPENLVPRRLVNQCRFWDCRRFQIPYCSLNHEALSALEEDIQRAIVIVDGFEMREQEVISHKILMAKAEVNHCGVPALASHVLHGNPWEMEELNANLIEQEKVRNWLFTSGISRPGSIWQHYDNRRVDGNHHLRRIRYNLRPQPEGSTYKLHQYSLENTVLDTSVFWIIFTEEPLGKQDVKRAMTCLSTQEPQKKKVRQDDSNLPNPPAEIDNMKHELKHHVQSSNNFSVDVKCKGCFSSTASHSTGGKARLTEGCSLID